MYYVPYKNNKINKLLSKEYSFSYISRYIFIYNLYNGLYNLVILFINEQYIYIYV